MLSFSERVKMNLAGHSIKQKNVLTADEEEFVPLDMSEEEYQKIKEKKAAEKKKRQVLTRNSNEPAGPQGPRKFFSATAVEKKSEENDEEKRAREQKQREMLQRQMEKERELEEK